MISDTLPQVSVIIPTYNYARFIGQAIDSIMRQTYPAKLIEIIVVDDGSNDNTKEVLQTHINNGIIKYIFQENRGKAHATYHAIQKCSGKYIFNLDADDFYFNDKIIKTVNIFETDAGIVHVATPAKRLDDQTQLIHDYEKLPKAITGQTLDGAWLLKYFFDNNILYGGGSTYSARASVLKKLVIPPEVDMYIDEFLIVAVLPYGSSFFMTEPLSIWRGHGYNYSESAKTKEEKFIKENRLLKSSEAILKYLKQINFDKHITKVYELKYLTALIAAKEGAKIKSLAHICKYAFEVFLKLRLSPRILKRYHVYNRLLPTPLFSYLKSNLRK